jgi:hypothetical protein
VVEKFLADMEKSSQDVDAGLKLFFAQATSAA